MIGELLEKIRDAENGAANIIADARMQAAKIETDAQLEIEKIKRAAEDSIAKAITKKSHHQTTPSAAEPQGEEALTTDKAIAHAKKFILEEFNKRYSTP